MLPQIRCILYTTDLSANAAVAFRHCIAQAQMHGATVVMLHVVPPLDLAMATYVASFMGKERFEALREEKKRETIERIKRRLEQFTAEELKDDPQAATKVTAILLREGDPVVEILETANRVNADLVVMGTHSKGLLEHTFFGSVAQKVLRQIKRPVLVVPIPHEQTAPTLQDGA
jgi:nucleotide-binding universal stress UspA family protein